LGDCRGKPSGASYFSLLDAPGKAGDPVSWARMANPGEPASPRVTVGEPDLATSSQLDRALTQALPIVDE
jgi:hypothetical protein